MGGILEMMLRNGMILALVAVLATGCGLRVGTGSGKDLGLNNILNNINAVRGKNAPTQPKQQKLSRAQVDQIKQTIARVKFSKYGITVVMTQIADREGFKTYLSPAQQTVTLKDGQIRMTRGLPFDLLESDFRADGSRAYRYLTTTNGLAELRVNCSREAAGSETIEIVERSYNTTVIEETCRGSGAAFKNRYWVGSGNQIWKSEQWLGPRHGFAIFEKLN